MKQYVVNAYDHTDTGALDRRMQARPFHLEGARRLKAAGHFIVGGAILDEAGRMIGSTMILQFEDEQGLEEWKRTEPYIVEGVWERFDVQPFRVAEV